MISMTAIIFSLIIIASPFSTFADSSSYTFDKILAVFKLLSIVYLVGCSVVIFG